MGIQLSDFELGYVVGLLDGEGHITITNSKQLREYGKRVYDHFQLQVRISNTNAEVIEWLDTKLERRGRPIHWSLPGNRKVCYQWISVGRFAREFLQLVAPHVIVKRRQVDVALRFIALESEIVPAKRMELWREMRGLNHRGNHEFDPSKLITAANSH